MLWVSTSLLYLAKNFWTDDDDGDKENVMADADVVGHMNLSACEIIDEHHVCNIFGL